MFSLPTLFLLALTSTLTTCSTLDSLNTINADTLALTAALNTYQGGLVEALPIQTASDKLIADLQIAVAASAVFADDGELQAALTLSVNTLAPNVEVCAQAVIAKKGDFDAAGATGLVKTSLTTISTLSSQYGSTILSVNAAAFADGGGRDAQGRIDAALSGAVAAYA